MLPLLLLICTLYSLQFFYLRGTAGTLGTRPSPPQSPKGDDLTDLSR